MDKSRKIEKAEDFLEGKDFSDRSDAHMGGELFNRFVAGRPIELELDRPQWSSVEDGRLRLRVIPFRPGFLLAHELGHIVDATDEEFWLPNLGMNDANDSSQAPTQDFAARETNVFAIQHALMTGLGCQNQMNEDRVLRVLGTILGWAVGGAKEFREIALAKKAEWTYDRVAAELNRKFALLGSKKKRRKAA